MSEQDERDMDELLDQLEDAVAGILPEGVDFTLFLYVKVPGDAVVLMHDGGCVSSLPSNLIGTMAKHSVRNMKPEHFADPEVN